MTSTAHARAALPNVLYGGLFLLVLAGPAIAADPASKPTSVVPNRRARLPRKAASSDGSATQTNGKQKDEALTVDLLQGLKDGQIDVEAQGTGDGRMTVSVTNNTNRQLRVVLPPGLIASGATGQFGGMGGMGGGMGGMGMGGMGGGMGGMGMGGMGGGMGGMGGMGGGMGGMGGGMGGMGRGGMGGGGMLTMPPQMGMMMLGRLIMMLVGDRDSWDYTSLMMGMGGMGGMGMGGMGGGMGGMGGGMGGMGGMMGGGMRSVPATGSPHATLSPGQTRHLPTRLVSLNEPGANARAVLPAEGEKLEIGEIGQVTKNARLQAALRKLSEDKAPLTVAQLAIWQISTGADWSTIQNSTKRWVNANELALAKQFVDNLGDTRSRRESSDAKKANENGTVYLELKADDPARAGLVTELTKLLDGLPVLGLTGRLNPPDHPTGPALACRVRLDAKQAHVAVSRSDASGTKWQAVGEFDVALSRGAKDQLTATEVADAMAEGLLTRLVRAQLVPVPKSTLKQVKGSPKFTVRIDNGSPLVLNGVVLGGAGKAGESKDARPAAMAGFSVSPGRSLSVPAPDALIERLGLKEGVRVIAADLSAL